MVWWRDKNNAARPVNAGQEAAFLELTQPEQIATGDRAMGPFFEVPVQRVDGSKAKAPIVPFCNIGRWYKDEQEKTRGVDPQGYSYAIWLQDASAAEFTESVQVVQ